MGHNFFHPSRDRFLPVGTPYLLSKLTQPLRGIREGATTSKFAQVAQLRTPEVGPLGRNGGPRIPDPKIRVEIAGLIKGNQWLISPY